MTEQEVKKFQKDLSGVLAYFDILRSAETSAAEPMTHSFRGENITRNDIPRSEKPQVVEKLLEMAPSSEKGFVKVKEVFDNGASK